MTQKPSLQQKMTKLLSDMLLYQSVGMLHQLHPGTRFLEYSSTAHLLSANVSSQTNHANRIISDWSSSALSDVIPRDGHSEASTGRPPLGRRHFDSSQQVGELHRA